MIKTENDKLNQLFQLIKFTPFIGKEERESLSKSFYSKTNLRDKAVLINGIRYNYCNHNFLKGKIYNLIGEIEILNH